MGNGCKVHKSIFRIPDSTEERYIPVMKKKILSLALAVTLILSCCVLAACSDNKLPPAGNNGDDSGNTTQDNGGKNDETNPPDSSGGDGTNADGLPLEYFDNYVPDENAKYTGKVGVGGTGVSFDKLTVRIGTKVAYENDFDSSSDLPEGVFSVWGGALSDWSVADDTVTEGNKKLAYGGGDSILSLGNTAWGPYRFITAILLDEGGHADIYFCAKDENNYYKLVVTTTAEDGVTLVEKKDGTETQVGKLALKTAAGSWVNVSANVDRDEITVYVNGVDVFRISEDAEAHVYSGLIGIGQWQTEFYIDDIVVTDTASGKVVYSQNFEDGKFMETVTYGLRNGGNWSIANTDDWEVIELDDGNHVLHYKNKNVYGSVILFDPNLPDGCTGYTFSYKGYKVDGNEGFPCVWDWNPDTMVESNGEGKDYMCFNLGGWSGEAAFQVIKGGAKENLRNNAQTGLLTGEWQTVELVMTPESVFAFFHGDFIQAHWY